jgi:uncharacterized protein YndB with AHSA1/START domain
VQVTDAAVVRVQRVMPAPPEVVFDQWLDPESLSEWMCPHPDRCVHVYVDPRVGGRFRFDVDSSGTLVLITGRFLAVDRPRLLKMTWSNSDWPDPTVSSVLEVSFTPVGEGETAMSIEHALLPPHEYDSFHGGWTAICGQLADALTG